LVRGIEVYAFLGEVSECGQITESYSVKGRGITLIIKLFEVFLGGIEAGGEQGYMNG
jgi:hypothetical protein